MINKMIALLTAALLCVAPIASMAESATEPAPVVEEGNFFDEMRGWWQDISTEAANFNAGVAEFFSEGTQAAREAMGKYLEMAEEYLRTIYPEWDEETAKAWKTIREAVKDGSAQAKEKAAGAYKVIRDWMLETGETMSEGTKMVLEMIRDWAGVKDEKAPVEQSSEALPDPAE